MAALAAMPRCFLACLLFLPLVPCPALAAEDAELRAALEKTYHGWRSALINKDVYAWQRATSLYRQTVTRNLIISGKQPYPDSVFAIPIQPPEITKLRLLECEARGPTAHLVYFGRVDLGLDAEEVPENILQLKFVNENGAWKFDTTRFMNLEDAPEVRAALKNGKADFLNEPSFTPSGIAPPVPPQCRQPEYVAALQIQSYGYEVAASMNGFHYPVVADNAEQQLIIGGLAWGKNDLTLKVKPLPVPPDAERFLEVNALIITGKQDKPQVRIFSWETKVPSPPAEIVLPVWVSNGTLKGV